MGVLNFMKKSNSDSSDAGLQPSSYGISIDFLLDFNDRLFKGYEGVGVQLFVCVKDSPIYGYNKRYSLPVKAGETIQFKYEIDSDEWYGYIPNRGLGTFNPKLVRPKVREEWTIEDVTEYVIKAATARKDHPSMTYVDLLNKEQVGKPFKGTFMYVDAKKTEFRSFVQSLGLYFDSVSNPEERYVWLDAFSAPQHKLLRGKNFVSSVAHIAGEFSQRLHYFGDSVSNSNEVARKRQNPIFLKDVSINGQLSDVCIEYGIADGLAGLLAHFKYIKSILSVHAALFGDLSLDAKEKMKMTGKKGKAAMFGLKRASIPRILSKKSSKSMDLKKDKKGKVTFMNDIIDMSQQEILSNDGILRILSEFLPQNEHPDVVKAGYLEALINSSHES